MTAFEVLALIGLVILIGLCAVILVILLRSEKADLEPKLEAIDTRLNDSIAIVNLAVTGLRTEVGTSAASLREELSKRVEALGGNLQTTLGSIGTQQNDRFDGFGKQLIDNRDAAGEDAKRLRTEVLTALGELGRTVEGRLDKIRSENGEKLEQMRATVDEKLQSTLEKRLGASFTLVNENLERVFKSVGEMQALATGVGDLKRVLSNVKLRGTLGEGALGDILDDMLTPEQFSRNVEVKPHSGQYVEFALKLPGSGDQPVWVPIDSKLPHEDYDRLKQASERGDVLGVEESAKALERCILKYAKDISEKYVCPPHSTDFAILFLPSEGIFAEIIRRPGLADKLRQVRVAVTCPTTLTAYLNALRMGFKSLAIQQRSSEVWQVLGAVKTEFDKFGTVLDKVHKKLGEAQSAVDDAHKRRRVMNQKLRDVEALPETTAQDVLALSSVETDERAGYDDDPNPIAAELSGTSFGLLRSVREQEKPMSIRKMIALHPDVAGHVNQPLGDAVHHLMYCAKMCLSCADACSAEKMDMRQCIRMCLDCADICEATCRIALRRTGENEQVIREMLELCARVCDACAAECESHEHEHCKLCAQMCRECAEDCRKADESIGA